MAGWVRGFPPFRDKTAKGWGTQLIGNISGGVRGFPSPKSGASDTHIFPIAAECGVDQEVHATAGQKAGATCSYSDQQLHDQVTQLFVDKPKARAPVPGTAGAESRRRACLAET